MANESLKLLEGTGRVFEANASQWYRFVTDVPYGKRIYGDNRRLDELTVQAFFVVPKHGVPKHGDDTSTDEDHVNVLTVSRGRPDVVSPADQPPRMDAATRREEGGGILLIVSLDVARSRFEFRWQEGREAPVAVWTVEVPQDAVYDRLLRLYVEVSQGRVFASVSEEGVGQEGVLDVVASWPVEDVGPVPPSGRWRVATGLLAVAGLRFSALPSGFGLSDLRIDSSAEEDDEAPAIAYSGALNRLIPTSRVPCAALPADLSGTCDEASREQAAVADDPCEIGTHGDEPVDPDTFDPDSFDPPLFEIYETESECELLTALGLFTHEDF